MSYKFPKYASVHVKVNSALIGYVNSLVGSTKGDSKYCEAFDVNKDGKINTLDVAFFAANMDKWVDLAATYWVY